MSYIAVVDNEGFGEKVEEMLVETGNTQCRVESFSDLHKDMVRAADCLIIDIRFIGEVKAFMAEIKELGINKVIVVSNELNHPVSRNIIFLGGEVFYRHSPVTSLMYLIFGSFKPYRGIPQKADNEETEKLKGKLIAVHSPKGGTGKTTICLNTAIQYAKSGLKVLIIDFAQYGAIGVKLKITQKGTGISSILTALEQSEENSHLVDLVEFLKGCVYQYSYDGVTFDVIVAANPLKMEKMRTNEVEVIFNNVRKLEYDIVVIDTSSELSERNLALFGMADEILLTSIPDISCGWSLIEMREILNSLGVSKKCKLVVNMYSKYLGFSCRELEMELQYPLVCIVPIRKEIQFLSNQGTCIGFDNKSRINDFYWRIAENIYPRIIRKKKTFSFWGMRKRKHER